MNKNNLIKVIETNVLIDSDKSYELMDSYECLDIPPKTLRNLPYINCVTDVKDKLPKDFLQRFEY